MCKSFSDILACASVPVGMQVSTAGRHSAKPPDACVAYYSVQPHPSVHVLSTMPAGCHSHTRAAGRRPDLQVMNTHEAPSCRVHHS